MQAEFQYAACTPVAMDERITSMIKDNGHATKAHHETEKPEWDTVERRYVILRREDPFPSMGRPAFAIGEVPSDQDQPERYERAALCGVGFSNDSGKHGPGEHSRAGWSDEVSCKPRDDILNRICNGRAARVNCHSTQLRRGTEVVNRVTREPGTTGAVSIRPRNHSHVAVGTDRYFHLDRTIGSWKREEMQTSHSSVWGKRLEYQPVPRPARLPQGTRNSVAIRPFAS